MILGKGHVPSLDGSLKSQVVVIVLVLLSRRTTYHLAQGEVRHCCACVLSHLPEHSRVRKVEYG